MPSTSPPPTPTPAPNITWEMELRARRGVRIDYLSCLLEVVVFWKPDAASVQLRASEQLFVARYTYLTRRKGGSTASVTNTDDLCILSHTFNIAGAEPIQV